MGAPTSDTERGAALVEGAIVTPLIAAALAALVVTAVLWRDQLAVDDAAAAGARAAALYPLAAATAVPPSDARRPVGTAAVAASVAGALAGVPLEAVERVVIFGAPLDAVPSPSAVPPGCLVGDGPVADEPCMVLDSDSLGDPVAVAGCGRGACPWRDRPGVAVVGVLVRVRHPGFLGGLVPAPTLEGLALAPVEGAGSG